jgi:multiple sugar transport system ATP-binding protein
MRAELKKLQKELGITTIYVTHDQIEAMTMGDKIAIQQEGLLQQVGTPDDIYFHPSNVFVAGFIGSPPTNFFDCNLIEGTPCTLDAGEFRYPLPERMFKAAKECTSGGCVLGVRPQNVLVYRDAERKKGLTRGRLEVIEPLGDKMILDLKVGDYLVKAMVSPDFKAEVGDDLWISFPPDKIHIFDRKTGSTLV